MDVRVQIWFDENNTYFTTYTNFYEDKRTYAGTYWKGSDMLARGDWTFTYNNIDGEDTDSHGNALID